MPILTEHTLPQNNNAFTTVAVPQQSQPSPPTLMPKLQTHKPQPVVPYRATTMEPLPLTSATTDYQSEPISLEMFNRAASDLNEKGVINIKRYKKYLYKAPH